MNYTFPMDFPPLPPPFRLDTATVHLLVTLTFVIQSVVIGFHAPLSRHFAGIRTFLTSALLLAAGAFILVVQNWLPRGPVGLLSTALILWGAPWQTILDLCRRADLALYEAKKTRNRIVRAS